MKRGLTFLIILILLTALLLIWRPVAVVNGALVTASELKERIRAAETSSGQKLTDIEREQILARLIEEELVSDLADKADTTVTERELEQYFNFLMFEFGIEPGEQETAIREMFGWSIKQYQYHIARPELLRAKLSIALLEEQKDSSAAYREAQALRDILVSGKSEFAQAARIYSDDEASKFIGGDLGFFKREELPPWLSDPVFELELNEISEALSVPEGFALFQVTAVDEAGGAKQIRQILIRQDRLSPVLESAQKSAKIYILK